VGERRAAMTDEDRKFLTKKMGKCWHEWELDSPDSEYCLHCYTKRGCGLSIENRTFDKWEDFGAVKEKLWTPQFMTWLEELLSWYSWEQIGPEEKCGYYLMYYRNVLPYKGTSHIFALR
jgi:hypothetical protein